MKLFYLISIINLLCILFFKQIEQNVFDFGSSWTFSKILPYALLIIFGISLALSIKKNNLIQQIKKTWVRTSLLLFTFPLPFIIGFSFNPIYEGDFSLNGEKISKNLSPLDFQKDGITVIAIPGCKYCFESIEKLKKIKKRRPSISIRFIVCCEEEELLTDYKKEVNGAFPVINSKNPTALANVAKGFFPSFVKVKNKTPIYLWSNDQFGVRAIDLIERKTSF